MLPARYLSDHGVRLAALVFWLHRPRRFARGSVAKPSPTQRAADQPGSLCSCCMVMG